MEFLISAPDWGYTLVIALVFVALLVWKGKDLHIPPPIKKDGDI
jgi:hypothetical protein